MVSLRGKLKKILPDNRIFDDRLSLSSVAVDASLYRIEPRCIVDVLSAQEMAELFQFAAQESVPLTFRAAGTSLSGQAQGEGILVRISRGWKKTETLEEGHSIRLEPGVIGAHANRALQAYGKKIGPDPASIQSCMVGGIVANNASGMCCGTDQNTYRTLKDIQAIFPPRFKADTPVLLDTASIGSRQRFKELRPDLLTGLSRIRSEILTDAPLRALIERKYKIKNTMGYALNSFLDFEDPIEILAHLLVGSEGTLGFVSEVTYRTVPVLPHVACALLVFPDLKTACQSLPSLKELHLSAAELMDRKALRSVESQVGMPPYLRDLPDEAAILLVETRADSANLLRTRVEALLSHLNQINSSHGAEFSFEPEVFERWWNIRRGLFPATAKNRKAGSTVIIEDVAVPVEVLGEVSLELRTLLNRSGYGDAILFGHALDGNLHFVFTPDLSSSSELARYASMMESLSALITDRWHGSLKAEHGTGRNMAPFLEKEWGTQATRLMWRIKELVDPLGILNPDVMLSRDAELHLKKMKQLPAVDPLIDDCMECGFCESHCPSQNLTLTPRQRIAAFRESRRKKNTEEFLRRFDYELDQTCAADGMCKTACPVGINTGTWIKEFRARKRERSRVLIAVSLLLAKWMSVVWKFVRWGKLLLGKRSPSLRVRKHGSLPQTVSAGNSVVYFPSCISRSLDESLPDTMITLMERAGYQVLIPPSIQNQCCGLPFGSKGLKKAEDLKKTEIENALMEASLEGRLPIVCDTSPCSFQLIKQLDSRLQVFDSVGFLKKYVLSGSSPVPLSFQKAPESVAVHATCSSRQMGAAQDLLDLARACFTEVVVPQDIECCGFAGDKGFTHPELTTSALRSLSEQVQGRCREGVSSSFTCEIGLSRAAGIPYSSVISAVERATRGNLP